MTRWRDRSSWDIEVHRLKNRLRQQRYRARKREQKSKSVGETPLLADLFISSIPNVTNGFRLVRHEVGSTNPESIGIENGTEPEDYAHEDKVYGAVEAGSFLAECSVTQQQEQDQQQCSVLSLGVDVDGDGDTSFGESTTFSSGSNKIVQHNLTQMKQGCSMNTLDMDSTYEMQPLDHREQSRIMARRLKNRERQRRYRARKRLEADMKKSYLITQPIPLPVEPISSGVIIKYTNRVHCPRKWKEDARRAHTPKEPELASTVHSASEEQVHVSPSEVKVEPEGDESQSGCLDSSTNCDTDGTTHARRDWKTDARNKVDQLGCTMEQ